MDLTSTIEYVVQTSWARIVSLKWLLPLSGLRATESGIESRVFGVVTVALMLVFVALGLAIVVPGLRSTRFARVITATG